jgi:glycosyltransferase involved in cell wall biosynthesis
VLNTLRLLKRISKVSLVIASAEEIDKKGLDETRREFDLQQVIHVRPSPLTTVVDRMRFELDPSYLNTHFARISDADIEAMSNLMRHYDVIWLHTVKTANAFRLYRWPRTILDCDDLHSQLYRSRIRSEFSLARGLLDVRMLHIWSRRERELTNRFDILVVCSENDKRYLGNSAKIHVVPNGFAQATNAPKRRATEPPRIGFIGLLDYSPNRIGVEWFIQKVWPRIKRVVGDARLRLVGKESDKDLPTMGRDIDGLGYVDDPGEEIATWSAMIVPVKTGGGTRIKIAEAFSRRCPVVSTTYGAFGYNISDGEELLLADTEDDFGRACVRLLTDRAFAESLSAQGWKRFQREWTWDSIAESVAVAVKECRNASRIEAANGHTQPEAAHDRGRAAAE